MSGEHLSRTALKAQRARESAAQHGAFPPLPRDPRDRQPGQSYHSSGPTPELPVWVSAAIKNRSNH